MATQAKKPTGPDLAQGIPASELTADGMVAGHVGDEAVLVARLGGEIVAISAKCTHYGGPLGKGVRAGDTVRCPWHHACFSLRSGEALRAPALDALPCWRVEQVGERAYAREKLIPSVPRVAAAEPSAVVIVGGGAAGLAAADMLRREGYGGRVTMLSVDASAPYDRPNLSKDFLAGTAPDDWIPLRSPDYYRERGVDLVLNANVTALDLVQREVALANGARYAYGALLLATGADPVHIEVPGARPEQLFYLRSFADSRALVAKAAAAQRVVVVGASFIGLEVAASLQARGLRVHVVGPEAVPLERVLGRELGLYVRDLHEAQGVSFHLGATVSCVDGERVDLSDGTTVEADFIVLGVGVRPSLSLAQQAGLAIDRGILVDAYLQTSAPGVYAAGDVARWPDPHSGEAIRVEHWVVAQRQGQVAARNILGHRERYDAVPFFWSHHYGTTINYVGHAERWDRVEIDGVLAAGDAAVTYWREGRKLAVATIGRDRQSLEAEHELETLV